MFTLEHQDGNIEFKFEQGGFAIVDCKLYVSVETIAVDSEAFPQRYKFAIDAYPIDESLKSTTIKLATNPTDEPPNVYVYTSFHASEVEANVDLKVISEYEIEIAMIVISEDVNYYNDRAKPNPFKGTVRLSRKTIGEMWLPS